jgi:hypothetical protein
VSRHSQSICIWSVKADYGQQQQQIVVHYTWGACCLVYTQLGVTGTSVSGFVFLKALATETRTQNSNSNWYFIFRERAVADRHQQQGPWSPSLPRCFSSLKVQLGVCNLNPKCVARRLFAHARRFGALDQLFVTTFRAVPASAAHAARLQLQEEEEATNSACMCSGSNQKG